MNDAKHKAPKKTTRKKRVIYSLPPKKKSNIHLNGVNGGHAKSRNGALHEEATAYRTRFTPVPDVVTAPVLETEMPDVGKVPSIELSEELARIEKLNSAAETRWRINCALTARLRERWSVFKPTKEGPSIGGSNTKRRSLPS